MCKIEHGYLLGSDMVKEAAKQTDVDGFDQVSFFFVLFQIHLFNNILKRHCYKFELQKVLDDQRNETHPKFKAQDSKRYMDFAKTAQRLIDTEMGETSQQHRNLDDSMNVDDSQTQNIISDIDPITKMKLVQPVRNKHCNHIYGYQSVQQLLQKNPRLR